MQVAFADATVVAMMLPFLPLIPLKEEMPLFWIGCLCSTYGESLRVHIMKTTPTIPHILMSLYRSISISLSNHPPFTAFRSTPRGPHLYHRPHHRHYHSSLRQ